MTVLKLKHIHRFKDRHGKIRHHVRRPGIKLVPLPGAPGSAEFMQVYQAALAGEIGERRKIGKAPVPGTVSAAVVGILQSVDFLTKAKNTQNTRRRLLTSFAVTHGDKSVRGIETHHIKSLMAAKLATPNAANTLIDMVHWIMTYSIEKGWRKNDPTAGIKRIRTKSDGFHTWSEEEVKRFEKRWQVGCKQRLALDLLQHTGQRSADVRQMTRAHIEGDIIKVKQQKTGEWVYVPIAPELAISLSLGIECRCDASRANHNTKQDAPIPLTGCTDHSGR